MWTGHIPSWAIGVAVIIIATSLAKALRGFFRAQASQITSGTAAESDVARFSEVLDDVQKRLGELEERLDFAERLLATQREGERLARLGA